jgi:hypothetical protein
MKPYRTFLPQLYALFYSHSRNYVKPKAVVRGKHSYFETEPLPRERLSWLRPFVVFFDYCKQIVGKYL